MFEFPPLGADFWAWMAHVLWRYDDSPESAIYSWFNVAEAVAWWLIAAWVLVRHARHRRTWIEPLYVFMFIIFGLSDVLESYRVTPWLVLCKGLIFANLVVMRVHLIRVYYPRHRF